MFELIHEFVAPLEDEQGHVYAARVLGRPLPNGMWEGIVQFTAEDGTVLESGRETLQSSRDALSYWASGVEPVYLEGAFVRAQAQAAGARTE